MTEVFFRNPHNYIREMAEVPTARRIIWDRGILIKRQIDPNKHAKLFFGENAEYEILVCGDQGTAHLDATHTMRNPKGVYPTWVYGEDSLDDLEDWIDNPIGDDVDACTDFKVPVDERPVLGQDHRIILSNLPNGSSGAARHLYRNVQEIIQDLSSNVKIHLHNLYGYSDIFGKGFYSGDIDPRTLASKGRIQLPTGKKVTFEHSVNTPGWITLLDMKVHELKEPRNRCIYNIKSALWAGDNFTKDLKFKTTGKVDVDPTDPVARPHRGARVIVGKRAEEQPGDKTVCNSCSLQDNCKFFREDAVCSLPESETSQLATYFKSRDSNRILDALGALMGAQASRLERAVEDEEMSEDGLDPEVTKLMNSLFNNGVKLAKLVDPSLTKPGVQINVGSGAQVAAGNPNQLVARAVQALEDRGVPRGDITPRMIESMLGELSASNPQPPTEPVVIQGEIGPSQ